MLWIILIIYRALHKYITTIQEIYSLQTIAYVLERKMNTKKVPNALITKVTRMSGTTGYGATLQQILAQMPEIMQMIIYQVMVQVVLLVTMVSVYIYFFEFSR